ncbi:MAG: class I SAM-dependent methyltransferase, partial [Nitrospinota bacterium]|nr:class I SAM-dependent methyltransferase [Nitrospinota bacterium]
MKQILVSMLRRLWLLPLAEQMAFYRAVWRCRNSNKEFMASNPGYLPPPLWLLYESSGHASLQGYDSSGELIAAVLHKMIRNHAAPGALTVLDWGCGPARIIRHMRTLGPDMILFGSDYNPKSVKWLRETFTDMRFEQNGLEPPLPFEDGSLDVVYCLSVFTHLSARMHTAWINDVERVLKPGGIFIGSFHGEECRYLLL